MITKLTTVITKETQPHRNLALEEYLLESVLPGECIFYLWQNRHTVVIGKNQNCWKECRVEALERDGGFLARRLSGGGTVFHDLGNLNFTFLLPSEDYNLERQLGVILLALENCGIHAEKSGRNDITVAGRKCSGNAFYHRGGRSYHHGTLLLDVDMDALTRYLSVDPAKLYGKGVDSVRARVANLTEFAPALTKERLCAALTAAFGVVYGGEPHPLPRARVDDKKIAALTEKYASWEWRFGRVLPFTYAVQHRFDWGDFQLQLCVNAGLVTGAAAFSDAMHTALMEHLPAALAGCVFTGEALAARVLAQPAAEPPEHRMAEDIAALLRADDAR